MKLNRLQNAAGFSLVELMVALVLGLLIVGGMVSVFAGNKRSSELNTAIADVQENARFALEQIANDIRMAGYQGCVDVNEANVSVIASAPPTTSLSETAVLGSVVNSVSSWTPAPPAGFDVSNRNGVVGSHVLTLQYGGPQIGRLAEGQRLGGTGDLDSSLPLVVDSPASDPFRIFAGDYAIVANCANAELFSVTGVASGNETVTVSHGTASNDRDDFIQAHGQDDAILAETQVLRFNSNVYYVADSGQTNSSGDVITSLYRQSLPYTSNPPIEMVQGVENMRIAFGVQSPGGLVYVSADDSAFDPTQVEAIQVGLLISSWDRVSDSNDTGVYILAGQAISPPGGSLATTQTHAADQRIRLAFNTTVTIRNRR